MLAIKIVQLKISKKLMNLLASGLLIYSSQTALGASSSSTASVDSESTFLSNSNSNSTSISNSTSPSSLNQIPESTKAELASATESEIPLNLHSNNNKGADTSSTSKVAITLVVLVALLAGGLFLAKKFARTNITSSQNQIKVLTQHWLGPKKSIAVIRVAGESMLIGITDQNINLIKSLSLLDEDIPETTNAVNFNQTLFSKIDQKEETPSQFETPKDQVSFSSLKEEEFSFGSIKKNVGNKLKNMRSLNS